MFCVACIVLVAGAVALLLFGRSIAFSYDGEVCVRDVTLLPAVYKENEGSSFGVVSRDVLKVGDLALVSLSSCVVAVKPPAEGGAAVVMQPTGKSLANILPAKVFRVTVPAMVQVSAASFEKPIPTSRPLEIPLEATDKVFTYMLEVNDKKASCTSDAQKLVCAVEELELKQGTEYAFELKRYFNEQELGVVFQKNAVTLPAARITDTSIKPGETVYAKPTELTAALDKPLVSGEAVLYRIEGEQRIEQPSKTTVDGRALHLAFTEELPRALGYELVIQRVEATDGSGLEEPYKLPFSVSGGPKVTGVSVGRVSVPLGVTVRVTFDQQLMEKQDISKAVQLAGGAALSGIQGNQLLISVAGVPKCGDFSIKLTNDIKSNYEIAGHSAWSFSGRMVCHSVSTIGYSVRGRPINAWHFGSGGRTVLFTGAIHGSERSTKTLMERWINELEANARSIPAGTSVVVIPQINPDGVAAGSRTNARNVDLNRNFATSDWRKDITDTSNRPFPGGGGESPQSEPETRALASFVSRLRPALVLSYHSIGALVAANQAGNSNALASQYSQLSGYRNTTGQHDDTFEYSVSGTADDWYAERLGVSSILIELGSHTSPQFERNQKAMWAMVGR